MSAVTIMAPQAALAPGGTPASSGTSAPSATLAPSNHTVTRSATIKWNDADIEQIISWLSERDERGVHCNLDEQNKGNKQHAAEKMPRWTGLINKAGVDKKKASDQIKGMNLLLTWRWNFD